MVSPTIVNCLFAALDFYRYPYEVSVGQLFFPKTYPFSWRNSKYKIFIYYCGYIGCFVWEISKILKVINGIIFKSKDGNLGILKYLEFYENIKYENGSNQLTVSVIIIFSIYVSDFKISDLPDYNTIDPMTFHLTNAS